jgi:hypothetical protein
MKKALVVLLILAVAGGVFAQFKAQVAADFVPDLFSYSSRYAGRSDLNVLTSNTFDSNELRFNLRYTGEGFSALLQLKYDSLVRRDNDTFTPDGTGTDIYGNNYGTNNPEGPNLFNFLTNAFGDYNVKGSAGDFSGYVGNEADRGKVDRFQNFDDFLKTKVDNYGVLSYTGGSSFTDWDINNFQFKAPFATYVTPSNATAWPWYGVWYKAAPFTIGVAGGLLDDPASLSSNPSPAKINTAVRLSGEKVADLLTFDVIYKIQSYDTNTVNDHDVSGTAYHTFGVYANLLDIVPDLGIGIGYSGYLRTSDDTVIAAETRKVSYPLVSGIDLRFKYKLSDDATVTFNNNFSFSKKSGDADDQIYGIAGTLLGKDASDGVIAVYNALGLAYKLSDLATLNVQVGNRFGSYTYDIGVSGVDKVKSKLDALGFTVFALYQFNANVGIRGGLDVLNNDYTGVAGTFDTLTVGFPVGIKIVF